MRFHVNSNSNLNWVTLAQMIGCVLVIFGHSFPFVTDVPRVLGQSQVLLYCFHMPLFVWCSGFLFAYTRQTEKIGLGAFAGKRAMKILVPYVMLSLVGIVPKAMFASVLNGSLSLDAYSLTRAFLVPRENIWGHFWFLPMIYLLGVGGYVLDSLYRKTKYRVGLWTVTIIALMAVSEVKTEIGMWLGVNDVFHFGWIYALGILVAVTGMDTLNKLNDRIKSLWTIGGSTFVASIVLFVACGYQTDVVLVMRNAAIAVMMIAGILSWSILIGESLHIDRRSLIAQTYQIFILSWPCQLVAEVVTERLLHLPWCVIMPSVFVTGVCGPLVLIRLVEWIEAKTTTRFLSFILGR